MRCPLTGLLILFAQLAFSQNYSYLKQQINILKNIKPDAEGRTALESWWAELKSKNQIPLVDGDSVYFFYRGKATSVEWMGDFNGWGYKKDFQNKGKQIPGTDLWYLNSSFPLDARLDYKILVNGTSWLLDPENKNQQWSGVGGGSPNSELRMPEWKEDPVLLERNNIPKGQLIQDQLLNSNILGYQVTYSVYLPNNPGKMESLPTIYLTDGYEYLHPRLGNMTIILDNLIFDKKILPAIAVFIDHREPVNRGNNRRMSELTMNAKYLDFFVQELIPFIEAGYPCKADARSRLIMGTSMGALTATYFAFARPDVFGLAGIQSPAYYTRPQIYNLCSNPTNPQMKISMTTGLINDTSVDSRKMKDILEASSCDYHYREVNEGQSWGNWKRLIDDILIDLLPFQ